MKVCQNCRDVMADSEFDHRFPFPAYPVIGGALGTAAALLVSMPLLIPVGLIGGMFVRSSRCDVCGNDMDDEDGYTVMESRRNLLILHYTYVEEGKGEYFEEGPLLSEERLASQDQDYVETLPQVDTGYANELRHQQADEIHFQYDPVAQMLAPVSYSKSEGNGEAEGTWSMDSESAQSDIQIGDYGASMDSSGSGMEGGSTSSSGDFGSFGSNA